MEMGLLGGGDSEGGDFAAAAGWELPDYWLLTTYPVQQLNVVWARAVAMLDTKIAALFVGARPAEANLYKGCYYTMDYTHPYQHQQQAKDQTNQQSLLEQLLEDVSSVFGQDYHHPQQVQPQPPPSSQRQEAGEWGKPNRRKPKIHRLDIFLHFNSKQVLEMVTPQISDKLAQQLAIEYGRLVNRPGLPKAVDLCLFDIKAQYCPGCMFVDKKKAAQSQEFKSLWRDWVGQVMGEPPPPPPMPLHSFPVVTGSPDTTNPTPHHPNNSSDERGKSGGSNISVGRSATGSAKPPVSERYALLTKLVLSGNGGKGSVTDAELFRLVEFTDDELREEVRRRRRQNS